MADVVTPEVRSRMMSGIRSKNTRQEVRIRKALHAKGFRYRLHRSDVPGKPDLLLPKYRAAVFVHGCFWHGHGCLLFKWPSTNQEKWTIKIQDNRIRDSRNHTLLLSLGWRICTVWECSHRGRQRMEFEQLLDTLISWIRGSEETCNIEGTDNAQC